MEYDYLSKKTTLGLKGCMCLCVLAHHLYQYTGLFANTYFGHFLNLLGSWAVAIFIFMSGYGLYSSYEKKGKEYLKGFLRKRLLPLYLVYLLLVVIYLIYDCIIGVIPSGKSIVTSILWGGTIVSFGWYFQMIYVLYIGFFLVFSIFKNKKLQSLFMFLFLAVYFVLAYHFGQWYMPVISFGFGILLSACKEQMNKVVSKAWLPLIIISFIVFFSVYMIYVQGTIMGKFKIASYVWDIISEISCIGIIVFVISLSYFFTKYKIGIISSPITGWIGMISLEIYGLQGIIMQILYPIISNKIIFIICVLAADILLSFGLHKIIEAIKKRCAI